MYYKTVLIDGQQQSLLARVNVQDGEYIDVKAKETPYFDLFPVSQIGLFESIEQNAAPFEPYDITWNSEVTWGTKQQPLIVKTLVGTNRNGECHVRLSVCPFVCVRVCACC